MENSGPSSGTISVHSPTVFKKVGVVDMISYLIIDQSSFAVQKSENVYVILDDFVSIFNTTQYILNNRHHK